MRRPGPPLRAPCLPAQALARWSALLQEPPATDPLAAVTAWIELLAARMVCTGGRLGRLLIAAGLCEVHDIAACLAAQLAAGPLADDALRYDVTADLDVVVELGPVEDLAGLSRRIAGDPGHGDVESVHGAIAARLLAAGREAEALAAIRRSDWHRPALALLERHGARMGPELRAAVVEHAARTIRETHLPLEYHVGLWVELAAASGESRWLAPARRVLASLPDASMAGTPDVEHPVITLAWGLARFGGFAEAVGLVLPLDPRDRWLAFHRLLPLAPAAARAGLVAAMTAMVEPLELPWAWLVEAAPETADAALRAIAAIADEDARGEQLGAVARVLRGPAARLACAQLLTSVEGLAPGSPRWVDRWQALLDALVATGCEDLLAVERRERLIAALLRRPDLAVWAEAAPFVPPSRAAAVLEHSRAALAAADHYTLRDGWIAVGLPLLPQVEPAQAERWLAAAARQLRWTSVEELDWRWFRPWSPAQRRAIVADRLAQHQHEFLPRQLLERWLVTLVWTLPPRLWPDWRGCVEAEVLARARAAGRELSIGPASADEVPGITQALVRLTSGWPTPEQVGWVFAALGRLAGEAALTAGASRLVEVVRRQIAP
ncbi:MAG: hypothetical protein JNL82_13745 [Myxococcales bacterium]|nr:hypothetical protein [Myxococcales bacterium]